MLTMDLESIIVNYVKRKTGERITIELKDKIFINPSRKRGSTILAIFWINVLQHVRNYPANVFNYEKSTDDKTSEEFLLMKAGDISFVVWLKRGILELSGLFLYDWFRDNFAKILEKYDSNGLQADCFCVQPQQQRSRTAISSGEDDECHNLHLKPLNTQTSLRNDALDIITNIIPHSMSIVAEENFYNDRKLSSELASIQTGCVKSGPQYIYKLWKSFIYSSFQDENKQVYVISPFIDCQRLTDIVKLYLSQQHRANLAGIYVRHGADANDHQMTKVKKQVFESFSSDERLLIEYHIYNKLNYPTKRFHCKFVASLKGDIARILVTSANFHASHFDDENLDFVMFQKLHRTEFVKQYLEPMS